MRIIGIPGSLRTASYNRALLHAAASVAPDDCELSVASIAEIPLYNADSERSTGIPAAVSALKERIAASDALLIATPEYNGSLPGVLKNAMDWLSRPPQDIQRVFAGRPVAVVGATTGRMGTALSQTAWLPVLRTLSTRPWFGRTLYLSGAAKAFDDNGQLIDADVRDRLTEFMREFTEFVKSQ